jgi:RNA polymerase sigma factor (sigma-70 family)
MDAALRKQRVMAENDQRISDAISATITDTVDREQSRLRNFIRRRVADQEDAEDILQDVFYELVEAYRLMKPVEQVTAWLFRVARNRITDLFRSKQRAALRGGSGTVTDEGEMLQLEEFLPSPDAGPDAVYARSVLLDELDAALDELPEDQREVFVAHELMGQSFKELSAETGVSVNTLLSRKHYAVLYLRERLQEIHDEFTNT